ncbi:unnamed protein product, partial [Choristocarpus tenellus]
EVYWNRTVNCSDYSSSETRPPRRGEPRFDSLRTGVPLVPPAGVGQGMDVSGELAQEEGISDLKEYLGSICPVLLGLGGDDFGFRQALNSADATALITRFSSDAQSSALFVELPDGNSLTTAPTGLTGPGLVVSNPGGEVGGGAEDGKEG